MKAFRKSLQETFNYLWGHKILFLPILFAYAHILAISLLNGNWVCNGKVCGIGIADVLFHDPIWHMALSAQAFNQLPFQMPIFSGFSLQGYHFLADFIYFLVAKLGFGVMNTYWKIMPNVFFILFVYLSLYYALKISKSGLFIFSYIVFLFLGGTISFIPYYIHNGRWLGAGDMFLQMNSVILSPNVAFSFLIFLVVLIITQKKILTKNDFIILTACVFLQLGMKFYAGLTLFLFLNLYNLLYFVKRKTWKQFFVLSVIYGLSFAAAAIIFYDPFSVLKTSSVFIFSPFTLVHPMIESPNMYYMQELVQARYSLIAHGGFSPRLIAIELFSAGIFVFHYFGLFNIGFIYVIYRIAKKTITRLEIIFLACALFTVCMVMFFIQKGYFSDTLQFLYYGMFFMSYFAAQTVLMLSKLWKPLSFAAVAIIVTLILPNNITDMQMPYTKQRIISARELDALAFLKNQPPGAIATSQVDDSSYIPIFTEKQVFVVDTIQLEITSLPYKERVDEIKNLEKINISKLPVRYFYILKSSKKFKKLRKKFSTKSFKNIFENKAAVVYEKTI